MRTLRRYLDQHGRPVAIYSDKHSIFRVNQKDREGDLTQFTRVLKTLDIQPIHANTPQAKGRVERANQTLQDRLVKELRLRRIDDIQSANAFLPEFISDYNQRFSVAPKTSQNAHRNLLHDSAALNLILSLHTSRKLSRNLTCRYRSREYQIQGQGHGYRLRATPRGRPRPGGVSGRERGARSPACAADQKAMRNPTFTKWSSRDLSPKRPE